MRDLKRSAIVVIPKQPLLEWLNFVDEDGDDLTLAEVQKNPSVYLLPEFDSDQDLSRFLRRHCKELFEDQLDAWITDDTLWPIDRGFDVFSRWFAISWHSIVIDLNVRR
jgi:hypothetical protein